MIRTLSRVAVALALSAAACLTPASQVQAQAAARRDALITGRVFDAATMAALGDVEVRLLGASSATATNARGEFRLVAGHGAAAILSLRRIGYEPVGVTLDLNEGDSLDVATRMIRLPRVLDTMSVVADRWVGTSARLAGFERRRKLGQGTFYTLEQLERATSITIVDLLRDLPSIKFQGDGLGTGISTRGGASAGRVCRIRVLVDGHLMPLNGPIAVTSPKEVRAIEVYAGPATMPLELMPLSQFAQCGLIAIWTK